ncbi:MAG: 23S rRNA methyltransferase [Herpetosiphonaceae bacterium]|nr:MAG: 23S rRNA methyltransferase [Herpetosiphonaceae bacterium]
MARLILKAGRGKSVLQRHPWVFSGAVKRVEGSPTEGQAVDIISAEGEWLARGTWSSRSQIVARLFTWDPQENIDGELFLRRLKRAFAGRADLAADPATNAYRLVFAESDGLPGLIVDRYADYLSVQFLTQGIATRSELISSLLAEHTGARGIYERSDVDVRHKEGLERAEGLLWGEEPPDPLEIRENGMRFRFSLRGGQKTGYYLDQRDNRRRVAAYCSGRDVLGVFTYTGGFEVYAAAAGAASVVAVDSSAPALEQLQQNMALNNLSTPLECIAGDAFQVLRRLREEGRSFDVVILDPPKFAQSQAQVERACRGYKDINMQALHLLRPGGILATCSCSGLVSADLFQKVLFGAALDAGREAQILEQLRQGPDHPVLLTFPESAYLKGLICRVW